MQYLTLKVHATCILGMDGAPTGLVVDRVTDIVTMTPDSIAPPRWQGATDEQGATFIKGLGKRDDAGSSDPGVSIILDVPRLLSARDIQLDVPAKV